jgi:enoyl-CoA hydratase
VFCRRFGVPLIDGGTIRLSKIIGLNRARDLILTGRGISGKEAYEWGLVNRLVTEKDQVMDEAIKLAK